MLDRFDRNIRFFGTEGQHRLSAGRVAVVGVGGLGSHVVQQLALLGVRSLTLIDDQTLEGTNLNRQVGAGHNDVGELKVDIGERLVRCIDPEIAVSKIPHALGTKNAFDAVRAANYTFGCLDNEGGRLMLNELCAAYERPYIDVASDIDPGPPAAYGGQICVAWNGEGCLVCLSVLNLEEARLDLETPQARTDREAIYGLRRGELGDAGPSVVSLNGVTASLAVTEFMVAVTGLRAPKRLLTYRGQVGIVSASTDPPAAGCYYCKGIRGRPEAADVERYIAPR
jgi:hypothetical protein